MSRSARFPSLLSAAVLVLLALALHPAQGHASDARLQPVARQASLPPCAHVSAPPPGNLTVSVPELPGLNCRNLHR